ncbi:hypothetical protein [Roseospira goensis]|uniref:Uncharacterized protein n=1 Tax=Roseospira goensis TaxID=391922 RepID=A0A7W6WMC6_9PROT|nr:hypothetical protein [Roseospira goensis]MBB4287925.1 hypothetical protein [Roseospira goensis]
MSNKKTMIHVVMKFIFIAHLFFNSTVSFSQEFDSGESALNELTRMLAQHKELYSQKIQFFHNNIEDPEAIALITDELLEQLRNLRDAIAPDSSVRVELEGQLEALAAIRSEIQSDKSTLSVAHTREISKTLEIYSATTRERITEIINLYNQIERDIVELESIKLFMTYQVRLSNYSGAAESMESIAEVLEKRISELEQLSLSIEEIQLVLSSD